MRVGTDSKGKELTVNCLCSFKIDGEQYEGLITYDEEVYSYVFEMLDDNFPCVLMSKADYDTINLIGDEKYITSIAPLYDKWKWLMK